jgi:hypothetical protein
VIIITILIAALVYIIQYKSDDWFFKPAKEFLVDEAISDMDSELIYIENSTNKDSLKNLIKYFFNDVKSFKEIVNLNDKIFLEEFNVAIADSIITDKEISNLTSIMKKVDYEKSKSN